MQTTTLAPLNTSLPILPEAPFPPKGSRPLPMERYTQEDSLADHGGVLDASPRQSYPLTLDLIDKATPLTLLSEFTRGFTSIQIARAYGLDPLNFALWLERLPPDMKATRAIAEKTYVEHAELVLARRNPANKTEGDHLKTTLSVLGEKYKRASLLAVGIIPVESTDRLEFHIHMTPPTPPATSNPTPDASPLIDITPTSTPYNPRQQTQAPPTQHPNAMDSHKFAQHPTESLPISQMMQQLNAGEDWLE